MRTILALVLALPSLAAPTRAQTLFAASHLHTGGMPMACASADLDGDGNGDLVVSDYAGDDYRVFLGFGNGSFFPMPPVPFPSPNGTQTGAFALRDVNGDGRPDLVAATYYAPGVAVSVGLGTGAFAGITSMPLPAVATSLRTADFDGDGRDDVLASSSAGSAFYLLRALGGGAFAAAAPIAFAPPHGPPGDGFAIADFDGDGRLDLAAPWAAGAGFSVWRNAGGAFALPVNVPSGGSAATAIAAAQLAFGGAIDVAILDAPANRIRLAIGDGSLGFVVSELNTTLPTGATALAVADADDDDGPDLLVASPWSPTSSAVSVLLNAGVGFQFNQAYLVAPGVGSLATTDVDSDGLPDALGVATAADEVTLLRNVIPPASGSFLYGDGTTGCDGRLGLVAVGAPTVPDTSFQLTCSNAPPNATGLCLLANVPEIAGADPYGLGAVLHVDLVASSLVQPLTALSDSGGVGSLFFAVPNAPSLHGVLLFAQMLWVEKLPQKCTASPFGLVSSRGFGFTFL